MATQIVMDATGDTRHEFDPADAAAVAEAENCFRELTGAGFTAAVRNANGRSELIRSFDPDAEETVFFPRLQGGWDVSLEEPLSHLTFVLVLMFCALLPSIALREIVAVYRICAARHHQEAEQKALALLKDWLLPTQLAQYESNGYFEAVGSHSGKRYRIRPVPTWMSMN
jgi:hypothetical protein